MGSSWVKSIHPQGHLRAVAVNVTELVQELTKIHKLTGWPAQALGEGVLGGLFLASYCKKGERININVVSNGQVRQSFVDAYPDGRIRSYLLQREEGESVGPTEEQGHWGEGTLSVLRAKDKMGERPYSGTVPLVTGNLAKDLSFYWMQSEQVASAVGITVELNEQGGIQMARGFLVQALPGATDEEITAVEAHLKDAGELLKAVDRSGSPREILTALFQEQAFQIIEESKVERWCSCSRERAESALMLTGKTELQSMMDEEGGAEMKCDFCTTEYKFSVEQLEVIRKRSPDEHTP